MTANWHPDPTGEHELRYWDGRIWTEHVADQGVQGISPLPTVAPAQTQADQAQAQDEQNQADQAQEVQVQEERIPAEQTQDVQPQEEQVQSEQVATTEQVSNANDPFGARADEPAVAEPVVAEPIADSASSAVSDPAAEQQAPATEADPYAERSADVDAPVVEAPVEDAPVETYGQESYGQSSFGSQAPAEQSVAEQPIADEPIAEQPSSDVTAEPSVTEEATNSQDVGPVEEAEDPVVVGDALDGPNPLLAGPVEDVQVDDQFAASDVIDEAPAVDEPLDQPIAQESAIEDSPVEEAAPQDSTTDEVVADVAQADESVAGGPPADEEPRAEAESAVAEVSDTESAESDFGAAAAPGPVVPVAVPGGVLDTDDEPVSDQAEAGTDDGESAVEAEQPAADAELVAESAPAAQGDAVAAPGISGDLIDGRFSEVDGGGAALQNSRLLRVRVGEPFLSRQGAMVAYQGDVTFAHQGGGAGRFLKKAVTGEGLSLMRVEGSGDVFLADTGKHVHILNLTDSGISVNGASVLAFSSSLEWNVERVKGGSVAAGGLFNTTLRGTGWVAITTDGEPVVLNAGEAPTFADTNAVVAWSADLQTSLKTSVSAGALIGRGSGEAIQVAFSGQGFVIVQPSEGHQIAGQS